MSKLGDKTKFKLREFHDNVRAEWGGIQRSVADAWTETIRLTVGLFRGAPNVTTNLVYAVM